MLASLAAARLTRYRRICWPFLSLIFWGAFSCSLFAAEIQKEAANFFLNGRQAYAEKRFDAAASAFESAAAAAPTNDEYVYWVGKAHGRRAETAGWLTAIQIAPLARVAFERAIELNPNNWDAVSDLAQYYDDAPGFLGGDKTKAAALRSRLLRSAAPAR